MLNILWGAMMLIGISYGAMTGRMGEITDAALSSAKEAVCALHYHGGYCCYVDGCHGDSQVFRHDREDDGENAASAAFFIS